MLATSGLAAVGAVLAKAGGAVATAFLGFATVMNTLFVAAIGIGLTIAAGMVIADKLQRKNVVRRNFPLLGRLVPKLDWFGKFMRNHVLESDRDEQPFNRAQRDAVYKFSKGKFNIGAFGSTRNLREIGAYFFPNAQFFKEAKTQAIVIGPYAEKPFTPKSVFNVSAMSYGALSKPAVQALSHGAKQAGCWLDTGEGGLAPAHLEGHCDLVFEIGTAKFGVRDADGNLDEEKLKAIAAHDEVKMISVKIAQGAKPGEGGVLPARKVTPEIAAIRGIPVGQDAISPDHHKDINSVTELLDFITHVKKLTGKPVGFKTIYSRQEDVEELCREIKKRPIQFAPDFICLDGGEGGTGAAPEALMDHVGMSIRESLPMVAETMVRHGLKDRIKLIPSGKLVLPEDIAWALAMGADFVNSARGFLFSMGCVQAMRCNKDTCPTGLTTNNVDLQKGFNVAAKAEQVANYDKGVVNSVEIIAHSCGVDDPRKLRPQHVHMVLPDGRSAPMSQLYPELKF